MESGEEHLTRAIYYCREKYWRSMQNVAIQGAEKFPGNASFRYLQGLSLIFQHQSAEALRILTPLTEQHTFGLGSIIASIAAHRQFPMVDEEEVQSLETKMRELRKTAKPNDLYFAGLFVSLSGKHEKSKEYVDRSIESSNGQLQEAISLRGWIEIEAPSKNSSKSKFNTAADYFDTVLASNRNHLDSRLGLAKCQELNRDFSKAMDELNAILSKFPNWIPSLLEKMKICICMQDWDQAMENVNRILSLESNNLEAFRFKILFVLCREGNIKEATTNLDLFFILCKKHEPKNAAYFAENGRLFSQMGSYSKEIISKSLQFAKYAVELEPEHEEYIADVGRIFLLLKNYKQAHNQFLTASNMNNASIPALYGLITTQLLTGQVELAAQQLSFLREVSHSIEPSPELYYLDALLAIKENRSPETILTNLNESVEKHINIVKKFPLNMEFLKAINPEFIIKIVREYLVFAPQEPITKGMQPPLAVRQASLILDMLTRICPAHQDALFIDAHIKYLSGDLLGSSFILNKLLKMDTSSVPVHLLLAQVQLAQNSPTVASETLDSALSNNFAVRENPKYHLLLARVQLYRKEIKESKATLENALKLFGEIEGKTLGKKELTEGKEDGISDENLQLNLADEFAVYIELITALRLLGLNEEAKTRMEEATRRFSGTHLEGRLSLTTAEDHLDKGEVPQALDILQKVTSDQHHFVEAQKMMADIYLNYKRDRKAYVACFAEISKHHPTPPNLVLLGEAYMNIQEPDKAIEAFENALMKNPRDPLLTAKLGEALVRTHQFRKAIQFYQDAVKSDENFPLRLELANLQFRLGKWDGAEKTIQQALGDLRESGGLVRQIAEVDLLTLLAKVQRGAGNYHQAQQTLIKAKDFQSRVLKRALLEQPSLIDKLKVQYCKICQLVGEIAERPNEIEFAIKSIREAIELCPEDWEILSTLCKLYMKMGDFSRCQQTCVQLQAVNPESDASIMLGELCYRRGDFTNALLHYQNDLNKHPTNWESLSWYIDGARRCGFLGDCQPFLQKAIALSDSHDPGLGYCQGLYEWYSGNVNTALKMLNVARKDPTFGQRTILLIIDIYLNPTGSVLGGDALDSSSSSSDHPLPNGSLMDTKEDASKAVEALLRDITIKSGEEKLRRQILDCYSLIITRSKNKVEKAIQELTGLVTTDIGRESVMLVHALAIAYMFMKQVPRARNQLKRIVKANWTVDDAEYLERCWLLLADIYIQSSKYDLATDLIKKVLQFNKSCIKANEYLGLIMEKEQAYADAAINYEQAWKLTNSDNPSIGYKLAFNYLKAKRYTDAIDVCHVVIKKHPNYPKIRKEILDKARNSLRL